MLFYFQSDPSGLFFFSYLVTNLIFKFHSNFHHYTLFFVLFTIISLFIHPSITVTKTDLRFHCDSGNNVGAVVEQDRLVIFLS